MTNLNLEITKRINDLIPFCQYRNTPYGNFPTKGGDGGDDCLWNGLLSSVDVNAASDGVKYSQAGTGEKRNGMFYRNPERRFTDNAGHPAFFSRDMAHGVLLAYCNQKNLWSFNSKNSWLHWIDNNRTCAVKKPKWLGGGCAIRGPFRYAPDDRSDITPTMWAIMGRVWDSRGWNRHSEMKRWQGSDGDLSVVEAENAPLGYQLHLKAVQSYIKLIIGQSREYRQRVSRIAYQRQPDNLFYKVLSQEAASDDDKRRFLDLCPKPITFQHSDHWIWERGTIEPHKSCGWDFVFLGNFMKRI